MKGKIYFKNEPFMTRVVGKSDEPIRCIPVVYDQMSSCGVGVLYEDGKGHVWGMVAPRNLIAAWRGTEVLRRLDIIEQGTLCAAYYTGVRNPYNSDMESYVKPIIAKIGEAVYNEIMAMSVPEQIIRAILDNQNDKFPPDLYPITDEVRAGTIQWRQEFSDAGIEHPDQIDAKRQAQEDVTAKFEQLLTSYAGSLKPPQGCMCMNYAKDALLTLVEKGAGQKHPDRVLVAVAGVVAELIIFEFSMIILSTVPPSHEEYNARLDKAMKSAIDHSVKWLASNSWRSRLVFWNRQQDKELIRRLLEEYFPPKPETVPV